MTDDKTRAILRKLLEGPFDGGPIERAKNRVAEGRRIENSTDTEEDPDD